MIDIDKPLEVKADKTQDVSHFFGEPIMKDGKKHRKCRSCM